MEGFDFNQKGVKMESIQEELINGVEGERKCAKEIPQTTFEHTLIYL